MGLEMTENAPMVQEGSGDEEQLTMADSGVGMEHAGRAAYSDRKHTGRRGMLRICVVCAVMLFSLFSLVAIVLAATGTKPDDLQHWFDGKSSKGAPPPSHYDGYETLKGGVQFLPEYNAYAVRYRHNDTMAEVFAFVPKEQLAAGKTHTGGTAAEDKVFGVSFRTIPAASDGVAHILEHSVLDGSRRYPTKDPFRYLLKSSLHTYLNAMTYNDRTVYPVASRNKADFRNLRRVYMDAVFRPNAVEDGHEWIFQQEGWRYEVDANDNLDYSGVVYSEMKGVFSDPSSIMYRKTRNLLFPENTYRYDSGGDPDVIPTLTREAYIDFYHKFYRPSNAKIFVCGTADDVTDVLDDVDNYFREYMAEERAKKSQGKANFIDKTIANEGTNIMLQQRNFQEPVVLKQAYASSDDEAGRMFQMSWLLDEEPFSPMEEMAYSVLDTLLLGTYSAVLQKALDDSQLGAEVIDDGVGDGFLQLTYTVGLKGIEKEETVPQVKKLILDTLQTVADNGFDPRDVQAAINTVEFELRESTAGSTPYGLHIFLQALTKWNYDLDPLEALQFREPLEQLKANITASGSAIFQNLIRRDLLQNLHRVEVEFYPRPTLADERQEKHKEDLAQKKASFSQEEWDQILRDMKDFEKEQEAEDSPEVVAKIPTLSLSDIDSRGVEYDTTVVEDAYKTGVTLITHEVPYSSDIVYVDYGIDISEMKYGDIPLLDLLTRMMTEIGTTDMSDLELDRQIGLHTGGIEVSTYIDAVYSRGTSSTQVNSGRNLRTMLFVSGSVLAEKSFKLFELFREIVLNAKINDDAKDDAIQILREMVASEKEDIARKGHSISSLRIHGRYTVPGFLEEKTNGYTYLQELRDTLAQAKGDWPLVRDRLKEMHKVLLNPKRGGLVLNLTGEKSALDRVMEKARAFLQQELPVTGELTGSAPDFQTVVHPWVQEAEAEMPVENPLTSEGIAVPTKVSYVGRGGKMYGPGEVVPGSAYVALRYLQTEYLWTEVRVKNGAYGAMAILHRLQGTFTMVSYRDPNLGETLKVFNQAGAALLEETTSALVEHDGVELTRAIIGAIGKIDGPALAPESAGWLALQQWLIGETPEIRQKWREQVLSTTVKDIAEFAERLKELKVPTVAVVSSEDKLNQFSKTNFGKQIGLEIVKA